MAWVDLSETRAQGQTGHIDDHNQIHTWANDWNDGTIAKRVSDYASVQAALDDLSGGQTLLFDEATYTVENLTCNASNVRLIGVGAGNLINAGTSGTVLQMTSSTPGTILTWNTSGSLNWSGPHIQNMTFRDDSTNKNIHTLLKFQDTNMWRLEACSFERGEYQIYSTKTASTDNAWNSISHCRFDGTDAGNETTGIYFTKGSASAIGGATITGCMFIECGTSIHFDDGANHSTVIGCKIDTKNGGTCIRCDGSENTFVGISLEGTQGSSAGKGIHIGTGTHPDSGRYNSFFGIRFTSSIDVGLHLDGDGTIAARPNGSAAQNHFSGLLWGSTVTTKITFAGDPVRKQNTIVGALEFPINVAGIGSYAATQGIVLPTKAGAFTDADFSQEHTGLVGGVDTSNNRLYVRVGSTWRYATLT